MNIDTIKMINNTLQKLRAEAEKAMQDGIATDINLGLSEKDAEINKGAWSVSVRADHLLALVNAAEVTTRFNLAIMESKNQKVFATSDEPHQYQINKQMDI